MWSISRSEAPLDHPGLPLPLVVRTHPRARRLRLRVDADNGLVRLTCPPRTSRRAALRWAGEQAEWVAAQLALSPPPRPLDPGQRIPFQGGDLLLEWREGAPRTLALDGDRLSGGGPRDGFARRVALWLQRQARATLSAETAEIAAVAGVSVRAVSVGDAATRWGSCSARGAIRYNWRLILAPPLVRRWVVAHEVAHRVHMNHGAAFRALERKLFDGDPGEARLLLRRLGPGLKRVGRGH